MITVIGTELETADMFSASIPIKVNIKKKTDFQNKILGFRQPHVLPYWQSLFYRRIKKNNNLIEYVFERYICHRSP